MTAPDVDTDPLRAFLDALTPAARHGYDHHTPETINAIRTALDHGIPVTELARICSTGITRQTVNARGLVLYRLRREAGLLDEDDPMPPDPLARQEAWH